MKQIFPFVFNKRLFLLLFAGFIVATVAGTLLHECGHYLVAKHFKYKDTYIGYKYTNFGSSPVGDSLTALETTYAQAIKDRQPFPEQKRYDLLCKKQRHDNYIALAGGPLETMLSGTLGLCLLFMFRKSYRQAKTLTFWQWF